MFKVLTSSRKGVILVNILYHCFLNTKAFVSVTHASLCVDVFRGAVKGDTFLQVYSASSPMYSDGFVAKAWISE